jgi:DNA polymerase-3 subunit alpha
LEYGQKQRADREAGQSSLFGGESSDDGNAELGMGHLPDLPEWDEKSRLNYEKATLGFYVSGHPLASYRELLDEFATHTTAALREAPSGSQVAVGGILADLRRRKSKKGAWWASMHLEDLEGQIEVLVFPKAYEICQTELETERVVMVSGRVEADERLRQAIAAHPGSSRLYFDVDRPGAYQLTLRAEPNLGVSACKELRQALEKVVGPNRVRYRTKLMI